MFDFLFNRGKKNSSPGASQDATAIDTKETPTRESERSVDPECCVDVGPLVQKGGEVLTGDCSEDGTDSAPCSWSVQKTDNPRKQYRIVL
jgi:hypothetical protein